jgi:gluconolactonase
MSPVLTIHHPTFQHIVPPNAVLRKIADGMLWAEGPVYFPQGDYFLWSDIPNNRCYQWHEGGKPRVFSQEAHNCNGHTRDHQGRLISCEHLSRSVTRREHDGTITVLADSYDGRRLNSPNDVVVHSDGSIWFTDPSYGILSDYEGKKSDQEQPGCFVYRLDTVNNLTIVADDFVKPNGLAFSPDESQLYISDTGLSHDQEGPHHIRVFDVSNQATLGNGRVFAEIEHGVPDGFRVDVQGNIWTSSGTGVLCYNSNGDLIGEIPVPEAVSNVCFGGPKNIQLLITATTSVYTIHLAVRGC